MRQAFTVTKETSPPVGTGMWQRVWMGHNTVSHQNERCDCCKADSEQGETPPPDDKFIDQEIALAILLLAAWNAAVAIYNVEARLLAAAASNQLTYVETAAQQIGDDMEDAYDDAKIAEGVTKQLNTTFNRGLAVVGAASFAAALLPSRTRFNAGIEAQVRYYTNNYFRRIVHPTIINELQRAINAVENENLPQVLKGFLDQGLYETEPYWKIVANQDISRSHHYGVLRGMEERGYTTYEFVAILDSRTTAICRSMNGTIFRVSDGINHLESIASLTNPEDVKSVAPWVTASQVKDKTAGELVSMGVCTPPLHSNCRSTLRQVS